MKVSAGLGGRGTAVSIERKEHPNSHFEIGSMRVEKAHDGSFVINHRMRLKKKHEGKEEFSHGYREEETHTAADGEQLMAHIAKHFSGKKKEAEGDE